MYEKSTKFCKKKAEDITNSMITNILEIFRKSTMLNKQNQIKIQSSLYGID